MSSPVTVHRPPQPSCHTAEAALYAPASDASGPPSRAITSSAETTRVPVFIPASLIGADPGPHRGSTVGANIVARTEGGGPKFSGTPKGAIIRPLFPREAPSMKLVRFSTNGQSPRLGLLQGDRIADVQSSLAASLARRGVVRAQELAAALAPHSTRAFLEGGAAAQDAVTASTEWVTVPANSARLHAPIADPGKFICIGLNYSDHAAETNN